MTQTPQQYHQQLKVKLQRIFGVIGNLIGLFLIWAGSVSYLHPDRDVVGVKLYPIKGTISKAPEFEDSGRNRCIVFGLKGYPKVEFRISDFAYKAQVNYIVGAVQLNDSVLFSLDDYNYNKLTNSKGQENVNVCTFRTKEKIYITWSGYKQRSIADNRLGIYFAIIGIAFCIYYTKQFYLSFRNIRSNIAP